MFGELVGEVRRVDFLRLALFVLDAVLPGGEPLVVVELRGLDGLVLGEAVFLFDFGDFGGGELLDAALLGAEGAGFELLSPALAHFGELGGLQGIEEALFVEDGVDLELDVEVANEFVLPGLGGLEVGVLEEEDGLLFELLPADATALLDALLDDPGPELFFGVSVEFFASAAGLALNAVLKPATDVFDGGVELFAKGLVLFESRVFLQ